MPETKTRAGIDQKVVFAEELAILRERRRVAGLDDAQFAHGWFEKGPKDADPGDGPTPSLETDRPPLADADPVGLALSGGGVRSAAFALGILQAFHRFGLMRYVDYLSAVSGGTYAAGMFTQSIKRNQPYSETNCDLALERSGKSSEFVQRVSARGNYLFRSDLFLARFIPGFVLNLAPQLCLLTAIGSGVAFLWRCLDLDPVRDHLSAFGLNDLAAAYLPTILFGVLWILSYITGLIAASQPLKQLSSWMLGATLASVLIGTAVVIGNGDVTFNTSTPLVDGDEPRIEWLNSLWTPLVSIVGLGCIPLLMPKKLLRSGTQPRGWFDSWVFYYVSLALFIGVPLVFVGYFAKENISGFNDHRGATFLPADIKDPRTLAKLLDPTSQSQIVFQFSDVGKNGQLSDEIILPSMSSKPTSPPQAESPSQTDPSRTSLNTFDHFYATLKPAQTNTKPDLIAILRDLADLSNQDHNTNLALGNIDLFPSPLQGDSQRNSALEWSRWRYINPFSTILREKLVHLSGRTDTQYERFLNDREKERDYRIQIADILTNKSNKELLYDFNHSIESLRHSSDTAIKIVKIKEIPPALHEHLMTLWSLDLDQDDLLAAIPIQSRGALNRSLLETTLPNIFRDRNELRRMNLIVYDQTHRLIWFVSSLAAAIVLGLCINPNETGLHGYYRDRLAGTYLNRSKNQPGTVYPELDIPLLSDISTHEQGAAYPLFQTSVLTREAWEHADQLHRPFQPFILSPAYCGNRQLQYLETNSLGKRQPSIADTIAISGGAIAPAFFVHHILAFLVNTMNWRMGQLFPNPQATHWRSPNMLQRLVDNLRQSLSSAEGKAPANVLLTDGGHSENLGIEPLLARRCRLIIVSDAGHDPQHVLDDLAKVIRRLESSAGIRLVDVLPGQNDSSPADGQPLRIPGNMADPMDTSNCDAGTRARHEIVDRLFKRFAEQTEKRHFFVAKILYPECGAADSHGNCEHPEFEGRLIYIKPCLTGDEGLQLCNYAFRHTEFPHESTLDQAFDEAQFEAYRRLGFHSGIDLCRELPDPQGVDRKDREPSLWSADAPWNLNRVCDRLLGRDNFGVTAIHNRVRNQIQELIKNWNPESGDSQIATALANFGSDLSLAADLLAQLPAHDDGISLHSAMSEHFDQRAVSPLANLLHANAQRAEQNDAVQRAITWLDQLSSDDEQIDLKQVIAPLAEVARWTTNTTTGAKAIRLLVQISEMSDEHRREVLRGLRQASKNPSLEALQSAAREAIANLRKRQPDPAPHQSNGRAKSAKPTTEETTTRLVRRKR